MYIIFAFLFKINFCLLLQSFASTRPLSPNDDGELRFAVRDLTENGSASSVLSHNAAIKSIKHYNKLQKSYS